MLGSTTSEDNCVLWCDVVSLVDLLFLPCQSPCNEAYTTRREKKEFHYSILFLKDIYSLTNFILVPL